MRAPIVRLQLVREASVEYSGRIKTPEQIVEIVRTLTNGDADEHFYVFALDVKNRINHVYEAAKGGSAGVSFSIKDIFRSAVMVNAAGLAIAHNHPSGDAEPSGEDRLMTIRVKEACELMGIRFLDSLVVTETGFHSISS